ncbi:MAG: kelch repeat-containing protein [Acidobacteriaceae bacterium]
MKYRLKIYEFLLGVALLSLTGCGGSTGMIPAPNPPPAVHNEWTWMGGNSPANYGTLGQPAASNLPPVRSYAATWTNASGNVWLFGGNYGEIGSGLINSNGQINRTYADYNDLWRYAGGEWTWMGGAQSTTPTQQPGVYGAQGQPSSNNLPGSRHSAVTWVDAQGNFWLFGGIGIDSTGTQGDLNDLWEYSNGEWTWIAGANVIDKSGVYGTQSTPASDNAPGSRDSAVGWADAQGNLWLFGGWGNDSASHYCYNNVEKICLLNDLWKFANGQWTWIAGSNVANQPDVYGTQGTANPNNFPGARMNSTVTVDAAGNVWLFGGTTWTEGLNDLWKYAGGEWTWVSGSNTANQKGEYGILGVPAASNAPGARVSGAAWTDASGNLWLLGGAGLDTQGSAGSLNDLWRFSGGRWTWMDGSDLVGSPGSYGALGVAAPSNEPPARYGASAWTRSDGSLWLFGGGFNDLWEYQP